MLNLIKIVIEEVLPQYKLTNQYKKTLNFNDYESYETKQFLGFNDY